MYLTKGMPSSWLALNDRERFLIVRELTGFGPISARERDMVLAARGTMNHSDWLHVRHVILSYPSRLYAEAKAAYNTYQPFGSAHARQVIGPADAQRLVGEFRAAYGHLYAPPNGGKRILPSMYTRLKKQWVRSNGQRVDPKDMNVGHLENTLKLLKESHGNAVAKATDLLGRFEYHFGEHEGLTEDLKKMCLKMQKIEVDQLYPIFKVLAAELASRKQDVPVVNMNFWPKDPQEDIF